jgi:hypothetical protein
VNKENMTVAVVVEHAEAIVSQDISIDALRKHGLTLPDFASTIEQQMEGFIQIGVDATGSNILHLSTISLRRVSPARGTVELAAKDAELCELAKVGLGWLDAVSE